MKPLTLEWIEKAEEDLKAYRARKNPAYNAPAFTPNSARKNTSKADWKRRTSPLPKGTIGMNFCNRQKPWDQLGQFSKPT